MVFDYSEFGTPSTDKKVVVKYWKIVKLHIDITDFAKQFFIHISISWQNIIIYQHDRHENFRKDTTVCIINQVSV